MKSKKLLIAPIVFFLLVNTSYYWEGKFGLFSQLTLLLLFFSFFILVVLLIRHLILTFYEGFKDKNRLILVVVMAIVLVLTLYKPSGLIDFEGFDGEDLLIAQYEGVANCTVTIKLKENFKFRERLVCFGVSVVEGKYYLQNDTLFLNEYNLFSYNDKLYKYAVFRPSAHHFDSKYTTLMVYRNFKDTLGVRMSVFKNKLFKFSSDATKMYIH